MLNEERERMHARQRAGKRKCAQESARDSEREASEKKRGGRESEKEGTCARERVKTRVKTQRYIHIFTYPCRRYQAAVAFQTKYKNDYRTGFVTHDR